MAFFLVVLSLTSYAAAVKVNLRTPGVELVEEAVKMEFAQNPTTIGSCPNSEDWFCTKVYRRLGAYSEQDCDKDGIVDYICDTNVIQGAIGQWANKRWILLSSNCTRFKDGDAPPCSQLGPPTTTTTTTSTTTTTTTTLPDCSTVSPSICPNNFKYMEANLCITPPCSPAQCCVEKEMCVEWQSHKCPDKQTTFYPSKRCDGPSSSSCDAKDCCGPILSCSTLNATVCIEPKVLVPSLKCAGDSCSDTECCQDKEQCNSIGVQTFCTSDKVYRPDYYCAGASSSNCTKDSCCGPPVTCKSSGFDESKCKHPMKLLPLNVCEAPVCEAEECCAEKEKCMSIGDQAALKLCLENEDTIFDANARCSGTSSKECTPADCCKPKTA